MVTSSENPVYFIDLTTESVARQKYFGKITFRREFLAISVRNEGCAETVAGSPEWPRSCRRLDSSC